MKPTGWLLLGILWLGLSLSGQAATQPAVLRFERLSLEQGLSQSSAQAIAQDQQGFLWIGTEDGLNRFDGYGFAVFRHDPKVPHSLSDNYVWTLCADHTGLLWIGTREGGVCVYDPHREQFTTYKAEPGATHGLPATGINIIRESQAGTIWVGTKNGLFQFDREHNRFRLMETVPAVFIGAICEDRDGKLWLGTNQPFLFALDPQTGQTFR
ncbi:MAG: GGDEF domain-containing protein, partial [Blastocatellia bacterium]|nr:GGDEF domain-containing protein [Blastocatellia bacterium]